MVLHRRSLTVLMDFKMLKTYQQQVIWLNSQRYVCKMKFSKKLFQPNIMSARSDKLKI